MRSLNLFEPHCYRSVYFCVIYTYCNVVLLKCREKDVRNTLIGDQTLSIIVELINKLEIIL